MQADLLSDVPRLPESRPLRRADKPLLDRLFALHPPQASELTFTNLYAWAETHPVQLTAGSECLLLWRGPGTNGGLLAPLGPITADEIEPALNWSVALGGRPAFVRIDEQTAQRLQLIEPWLRAIEDRDNADYVYQRQTLAELAGRKLDAKRNLLKRFESAVSARLMTIDATLIEPCLRLQGIWCDQRECSIHADLDAEDRAIRRVLLDWDYLGVSGGALLDERDGRLLAFTISEQLAPGMAVIHHEKADFAIPGAYQAINQRYCAEMLSGFDLINREQDLGHPGLRQAKLSYQPDNLVMKYTLSLPD